MFIISLRCGDMVLIVQNELALEHDLVCAPILVRKKKMFECLVCCEGRKRSPSPYRRKKQPFSELGHHLTVHKTWPSLCPIFIKVVEHQAGGSWRQSKASPFNKE